MSSVSTSDSQASYESPTRQTAATTATAGDLPVCDRTRSSPFPPQVKEVVNSDAEQHLKVGLDYMLAEGGKAYDGAKAMAAFGLAILLGNKEAMFRKAQMLLEGRVGVKRDAALAVKLFEELKAQGLYLPEIYYYLSKHALEKSLGRTAETYQLVSECFTKLLEMKYDDSDATVDHNNDEAQERKGVGEGVSVASGKCPNQGMETAKVGMDDKDDNNKKAAILFAQAGIYYIYASVYDDLKPYFRRQFPPSIRQWLRTHNLLDLCLQAKSAGCKEPELFSLLGYAYYRRKQGGEEGKVALENLTMACSLGISSALRTFGNVYTPGFPSILDCPKDPKKALSYYLQAEATGYHDGGRLFMNIGCLYWRRQDEERDGNKALAYIDQAISLGDGDAYYWRAKLYDPESPPCPPWIKRAKFAHRLRLEAELAGCERPRLFQDISDDYSRARGGVKDDDGTKAVYYLEKAIKYGGQRLYQLLGKLYDSDPHFGYPKPIKDDTKAFNYYLKEAEMVQDEDGFALRPVHPDVYKYLGRMYEEGRGTSRDYSRAVEYYKRAAKEDNIYALNRLGYIYDTTQTDLPYHYKDDTEARKYYEAAHNLDPNDGKVCLCLGNMYRDGRGGEIDGEMAIKYYGVASDLGYSIALYEQGLLYDPERKDCPPIEKDEGKAVQLYLAAEAQGCTSKQLKFILADCYRRGRGVRRNEELANTYDECLMTSSMK